MKNGFKTASQISKSSKNDIKFVSNLPYENSFIVFAKQPKVKALAKIIQIIPPAATKYEPIPKAPWAIDKRP